MNTTEIQEYLQEHEIYAEVSMNNKNEVEVFIDLGDWKHDHLYCVHLMQQKGYEHLWESVTDYNDSSDVYSATHYFKETIINEELKLSIEK